MNNTDDDISLSEISQISLSIQEDITNKQLKTIEREQILSTMETIEKNLTIVDTFIKENDAKTSELNLLVNNLMRNKSINLDDTCKILNFQIEILSNEKLYVQNIKNIFLSRFQKDIYEIGEKIMIIATSINTIQFEEEELNRSKSTKKVTPIKKIQQSNNSSISLHDTKSIYTNIDSIFNNLSIIRDTVAYLDSCIDYVNQNVTERINSQTIMNTHSNSLKLKRDYIHIEFKQHYDAFKSRVNYFAELIESTIKKIKV
jgi:hypothetical protein